MDLDQLQKRLDFLENDRRKDKAIIDTLEQRLARLEGGLPEVREQIKEMSGEVVRLSTVLSRFDQLKFLYATSYTQWPPRGRLQGDPAADGVSPISGNNASPAWAFGGWWTHHTANERLQFDGAMFVYDGFLWFFEKNTFRITDGQGFRSFVEIADRVSDGRVEAHQARPGGRRLEGLGHHAAIEQRIAQVRPLVAPALP